ncbi:MAG: GNAT family N-acetyltransferase [Deltaproteobacteria bacterium]|nr:GNAT family N-acetyltransferase [Deltaproteobacteria bacterium]
MSFASDIIREAEPYDINQMTHLLEELFSIEDDFTFNEFTQRQGLLMMLDDNEKRCIMIAESGDQIIGICRAQLLVSTAEGGISALIEDMIVAKPYRGQGIGKKLLLSIKKWAYKKKAKRMQLLADKNNINALDFYKKQKWAATQLICLRKKQERN